MQVKALRFLSEQQVTDWDTADIPETWKKKTVLQLKSVSPTFNKIFRLMKWSSIIKSWNVELVEMSKCHNVVTDTTALANKTFRICFTVWSFFAAAKLLYFLFN